MGLQQQVVGQTSFAFVSRACCVSLALAPLMLCLFWVPARRIWRQTPGHEPLYRARPQTVGAVDEVEVNPLSPVIELTLPSYDRTRSLSSKPLTNILFGAFDPLLGQYSTVNPPPPKCHHCC
ncbi:unnamed protein product, partial [Ectocarpus sp. 4 AP-2014]